MVEESKATELAFYPIGTAGKPWTKEQQEAWKASRVNHRSYKEEVLNKVHALGNQFDVEQYGALSCDKERYPLFCIKTKNWDANKMNVLVTGGVHGYETSGVQGAILFMKTEAHRYLEHFNILCCPCVSPWGYEHIERWSAGAVDPNRSFKSPSPCDEAGAVVELIAKLGLKWTMHTDLHETTNSDFTEFVPAKAARDGHKLSNDPVPESIKPSDCPGAAYARKVFGNRTEMSHSEIKEALGEHPSTAKDLGAMNLEAFERFIVEQHLPYLQDSSLEAANNDVIPDGFYLVGNSENTQDEWHKAIIDKVRGITHITKPDVKNEIIGVPISQEGVLNIPINKFSLCASVSGATYATTTEVYPDSPQAGVTDEQCNNAQVAVVVAGLDFIKAKMN